MSRLITFGCSMTYGHGLSDCFEKDNKPGNAPSKFAWPEHLGRYLEKDVVNKSKPGASNLEILYHILNFEFEQDDTVVILWSFPSRDLIFNEPTPEYAFEYTPVGAWQDSVLSRAWLETHTDHDLLIRSWLNIHHAEQYLENIKIVNTSFVLKHDIYGPQPAYLKFKNLNTGVVAGGGTGRRNDLALDGVHPGPVAHQIMADRIFALLTQTT